MRRRNDGRDEVSAAATTPDEPWDPEGWGWPEHLWPENQPPRPRRDDEHTDQED